MRNRLLDGGERIRKMRQNARVLIENRYDLYNVCLPSQVKLLKKTAADFMS